jgi:hypothetical protein
MVAGKVLGSNLKVLLFLFVKIYCGLNISIKLCRNLES